MGGVLIVYDTVSGSTEEIAYKICEELKKSGMEADVCRVGKTGGLAAYDAVIIGAPSRFGGLLGPVKRFIRKNRRELQEKKVFYFLSCLYVLRIKEEPVPETSFYIDPSLKLKTVYEKDTDIMDRTHSIAYYQRIILKSAPEIKPIEVALLNGRLDLTKLNIFYKIFMRLVTWMTTRQQIGDFVNPSAVKEWTKRVTSAL